MRNRTMFAGVLVMLLMAVIRMPVEAQSGVDLEVNVASSGYTINGELEYSITIINNGDTAATGVSFTSILPEQAVLVFTTSPAPVFCPVQSNYKVVCTFIDALNPAETVSASVIVHPFNIGTKFNTVTAASIENDLNPDDNTDFVYDTLAEVALAQLALQNTVSGPALVGQTQTYELIVTPLGDGDAQNVVVMSALPANVNFVSAAASGVPCPPPDAGVLTCTLGTISPASPPISVMIEVIPTTTGTFVNLASVTSSSFDPNIVDNRASSTFTIAPDDQSADVQVTKQLVEGSYLVTVTNTGLQAAQYVRLVDTLPAGATFETLSYSFTSTRELGGDPVCSVIPVPYPTGGGTVECLIPSLAVGETIEFEITVLYYNTGVKTNQVTVSAAQPDPNLLNNQASVDETVTSIGLADLRVEYLGGSINFEGNFNYNVNVLNIQDDDAQQVVFKQVLPPDVVIVSAQNTATGELCAVLPFNLIRCELGVMSTSPANSINVLVVAALPDLDPFTLISAVRSASFDANLSDNYLETLIDPNPATETPTATPTIETATPTVETATPTVETPTIETATPTVETATPTIETATPTIETATPTVETPTIETATPTVETATPTIETATPTVETATPTVETPTIETATPTIETATPTVETPTIETATPTVETATPVVETATPVVETATPVVETATPVVETATPIIETATPVAETATPVVETTTPVVETATPVVETATPVVETATPVVETATPVVETATPVVETATPVEETATPIIETATPVVETATPVVETATPVIETATPVVVTATPTVATATPTLTSNTATPTLTAIPAGLELLVNGGFEANVSDGSPSLAPWTVKNGTGEVIKCNKDKNGDGIPDKIFARSGNCAFRFKGGLLENSKLQQNIPLSSATWISGDVLHLSVFVDAKSAAATGEIKLRVKYGDGNPTGKITLNLTLTTDYAQFGDRYTLLSGSVTKIKVEVKNKSTSGKVYIDDASLLMFDSPASVLPVPPAP